VPLTLLVTVAVELQSGSEFLLCGIHTPPPDRIRISARDGAMAGAVARSDDIGYLVAGWSKASHNQA
jgi:hypothetical protein